MAASTSSAQPEPRVATSTPAALMETTLFTFVVNPSSALACRSTPAGTRLGTSPVAAGVNTAVPTPAVACRTTSIPIPAVPVTSSTPLAT
nr:hypothetical protein [Halopolyspora algeriensis]